MKVKIKVHNFIDRWLRTNIEYYCKGGGHSHNQYVIIFQDFRAILLDGILILAPMQHTMYVWIANIISATYLNGKKTSSFYSVVLPIKMYVACVDRMWSLLFMSCLYLSSVARLNVLNDKHLKLDKG